jgi:hypothetical protein
MATVDILQLIKLGDLTAEQKTHLKTVLRGRKQKLEKLIADIDRGLKTLGGKSKGSAKRKTYRRKKK